MRFAVLLSVCVSLATTSLSDGGEISQVHDPPALKIGATDLDAILLKTRSLIDAANGPEDSGCEMVKVSIDGHSGGVRHPRGLAPWANLASDFLAQTGSHA
ncbi:MAG: hypothetical protein DMF48_04420 [Verrucomicrobia bacterium]|nr:MAG: hypothetical protein DMF48_04420 [Verrucomicrobiota bacterium]